MTRMRCDQPPVDRPPVDGPVPRRARPVAATMVVGLLLVTGCGLLDEAGAGADPTPTNLKAQAAKVWQEFVACARKNGAPHMPDPEIESDGDADFGGFEDSVSESVRQRVEQACGSILQQLPASRDDRTSPNAAQLEALKKFATCMRKQGRPTWPDPTVSGAFQLGNDLAGIPPNQMRKLTEPCQGLLEKSGAQLVLQPSGAESSGGDEGGEAD